MPRPRAADVVRSLAFYAAFYFATLLHLAAGFAALAAGAPVFGRVAQSWARWHRFLLKRLLRIGIELEGAPPPTGTLIAIKHESFFEAIDQPNLLDHPAVFAKAELLRIPLWGRVAAAYGVIPIERDQGAKALRRMIVAAREASANGRQLVIFPEGTRVPHGETPQLKAGFAGIYKMLRLPVVPVAVDSGPLYRGMWKRPGTIHVRFRRDDPAGIAARGSRSTRPCRDQRAECLRPRRTVGTASRIVHSGAVEPILDIRGLAKTYAGGTIALRPTDLAIRKGEIFALLGPNGAGKTTLIGLVCGLVRPTGGEVHAFGADLRRDWRRARARIGLVPQELNVDMFEHVGQAVAYSRALFGLAPDAPKIEALLRSLALWDKREERIQELSGGMKRRVLIAKALAHEPDLLFLDEPTAGVDVELRRDMWRMISRLREQGVTIILTTHYIEEAEEMADRIGVIDRGELKLVEDKTALMARLGRTEARIALAEPLDRGPRGARALSR